MTNTVQYIQMAHTKAQKKTTPGLANAGRFLVLVLAVLLGGTGVILTWQGIWGSEGLRARTQLQTNLLELESQLREAREENKRLIRRIEALENDTRAQQDEIRKVLGLLRRDEVILVPEGKSP